MHPWQDLLTYLFREGRKWVSSLGRDDWRKQIASVKGMQSEPPLEIMQADGEFYNWIRTVNEIGGHKRKGFVLAPGRHANDSLLLLAPFVLSAEKEPRLSLQLGFMLKHGDDNAFFGYRFESPEEIDGDEENNEHDYYHAQPIKSFGRGVSSGHSIPWYPDKYPAFPLDAKCGMELISCMLLSSWGKSHLTGLATSATIKRPTKKELIEFIDKVKP